AGGAGTVTTAARVAMEAGGKAVSMFGRLTVRVLGVIENMSSFVCPDCHHRHDVFSSGDAETRARAMSLEFLGAIPLHAQVRIGGDSGRPVVAEQPDTDYARAFTAIAGRLAQRVSTLAAGER